MKLNIRQGETLEIEIIADDDSADTVNLLVADSDGNTVIDETENFSTNNGITSATIRTDDTDHEVGEYEYMLTIVYEDGFIEKLPDADCEDCDLPILNICKTLLPEFS